jgi:hypothetical protein
MIPDITDFSGLDKYVKNPSLKFREAIHQYYKEMGGRLGYTVRENPSVIVKGVNYGKMDMVWVEPKITFSIEFGNLDEIYKHLWKILEFSPNVAVLILSSKSACKAEDVVKIIEKSDIMGDKRDRFLVIDISEKKAVREPSPLQPRPC